MTKYQYTGQYSYTADFGLMFYNARWYDPSLGRFAQADTIVPGGVQGLDRYAYVNNSPMNYVDPNGHVPVDCYGTNYCGASNANLLSNGTRASYGKGLIGPPRRPAGKSGSNNSPIVNDGPSQVGYMGGASPADVYHWQDFSSNSPSEATNELIESFSDLINLLEMFSPNAPPTLNAFLYYLMSENGDVTEIEITIANEGESSATLHQIIVSEEALPNMNSCTLNTRCVFRPLSPVYIDPGEVENITICQNCLNDQTTIYSHPFYPNENNYIEVFMVLSMPIDHGFEGTRKTPMPFIYTIPPR